MSIFDMTNRFLLIFVFFSMAAAMAASDKPLSEEDTRFINDLTRGNLSTPYSPRIEARVMYGNDRSYARPMALVPLIQSPNKITYANFIVMGDTQKNIEGNVGFGGRWLKSKYILGGYVHFDFRRSKNGNNLQQITTGFEYLEKYFEIRGNLYVPLQKEAFVGTKTTATGNYDSNSDQTTMQSFLNNKYDVTRMGVDFEIGGQMRQHAPFSAYARAFYFHHKNYQDIFGVQIRGDYMVLPWLSLKASYTADNSNVQNHYFVGVNFILQAKSKSYKLNLDSLSRKMVSMPVRDLDIHTTVETRKVRTLDKLVLGGRGILVKHDNVEVSGNVAFNSIHAANIAFTKAGQTLEHVTIPFQSGKLTTTNEQANDNTMDNRDMEAIRLSDLAHNIIKPKSHLPNPKRQPALAGLIHDMEADPANPGQNRYKDMRGEIDKLRRKIQEASNTATQEAADQQLNATQQQTAQQEEQRDNLTDLNAEAQQALQNAMQEAAQAAAQAAADQLQMQFSRQFLETQLRLLNRAIENPVTNSLLQNATIIRDEDGDSFNLQEQRDQIQALLDNLH